MLRTGYLKIQFFTLPFFQLKLHNCDNSPVAHAAESAHHITRVGHHKLAACAERFIRLNAWTFRRIIPNDGEQIISSGRVWKTIVPIFIGLGAEIRIAIGAIQFHRSARHRLARLFVCHLAVHAFTAAARCEQTCKNQSNDDDFDFHCLPPTSPLPVGDEQG